MSRLQLNESEMSENAWERSRSSSKPFVIAGLAGSLMLVGMMIAALLTTPFGDKVPRYEEGILAHSSHSDSNDPPSTTTTSYKNDSQSLPSHPRNVILMISDGLGPASVSFARTYFQYINHQPYDFNLPLDTIHVGQSRTRSASSLVTDSAAGATAFSCGLKTRNRAVGVDPHGNPCGTILESAKHHHGMKTGLVVTSRITHATPASFSAHVTDRDNENAIAVQQIGDNPLGRSLDLMFGGGYCHFIPHVNGGCRGDNRHLFDEAKEKYGWNHVLWNNRTAFEHLAAQDEGVLPTMSLFAGDHMAYEINRDAEKEPSLKEMSDKALQILSHATKGAEKGFFLMIEGSRIDMAAHSNDAAAHVHDILAYQDTVAMVKQFVDEHPDTIMISTSDHETGGLTLARQVSAKYPDYLWYPDVLIKVKQSTSALARHILSHRDISRDKLVELLSSELGISDPTDEEIQKIISTSAKKMLDYYLADMISIRSQLGWTTHGHSGVDVNLYAYGHSSSVTALTGSHENTEIGELITEFLSLNLTDMTRALNHENTVFHLAEKDKVGYTDRLEHYHHDDSRLHHPS